MKTTLLAITLLSSTLTLASCSSENDTNDAPKSSGSKIAEPQREALKKAENVEKELLKRAEQLEEEVKY